MRRHRAAHADDHAPVSPIWRVCAARSFAIVSLFMIIFEKIHFINNSLCTHTLSHRVDSVDGRWSNWSLWSHCTANCGYGQRTRSPPSTDHLYFIINASNRILYVFRTRECTRPSPSDGGYPCFGRASELEQCTATSWYCLPSVDNIRTIESSIRALSVRWYRSCVCSICKYNLNNVCVVFPYCLFSVSWVNWALVASFLQFYFSVIYSSQLSRELLLLVSLSR